MENNINTNETFEEYLDKCRKLVKAVKKEQLDKIPKCIKDINKSERFSAVYHIIQTKDKYINPDIMRVMISSCKKLNGRSGRKHIINMLLLYDRFDLVEVYYEFDWVPSKKFINGYEEAYQRIKKENEEIENGERDESSTETVFSHDLELHERILNFLRPKKL